MQYEHHNIQRENASATARRSLTAIGRMKETASFMVTYAWRGNCVRHCRGHSRGNGGLLYDCIRFSRREQLSERETHHTQRIQPPVSRWRRKLLRSSWRPRGFHKCFTSPYVTISFIGIISTSMEIINHIKLTMKIDSTSRPDGDSNPGPPHYECRS